jgi:hypothetical protein
MSVLRLGSDPNGERKHLNKTTRALTTCPLDEKPDGAEVYVLLRSFEAREIHLRELDAFRAELPGSNPVHFLPDPLSDIVPSYHASMPLKVRRWIETRQEVVDVRRFRHPNGLGTEC